MHTLEPHYNWRDFYIASEDERSPFYLYENSEFEFTDCIYDHLIHPQWDNFGSKTLFIKVIFADYDEGCAIIEMLGEWNDCLYNDIMVFKRDVIDLLIGEGINKFILITENVLNFHSSDDCYYEEWFEDIEDGWIAITNARQHVIEEFMQVGVDQYFVMGGLLNDISWRTHSPVNFFQIIEEQVNRRLNMPFASQ